MKEQILELLKDEDVRAEIISVLREVGAERVFVLQPMTAKEVGRLGFDMRNRQLDREIERGDARRGRQIYDLNDKL